MFDSNFNDTSTSNQEPQEDDPKSVISKQIFNFQSNKIPFSKSPVEPISRTQFNFLRDSIPGIYLEQLVKVVLPFRVFVPMEKIRNLWKVHFIAINEWNELFTMIQFEAVQTRFNLYTSQRV